MFPISSGNLDAVEYTSDCQHVPQLLIRDLKTEMYLRGLVNETNSKVKLYVMSRL